MTSLAVGTDSMCMAPDLMYVTFIGTAFRLLKNILVIRVCQQRRHSPVRRSLWP